MSALIARIRRNATSMPNARALSAGDRVISYAQLISDIDDLAATFRAMPDQVFALIADNGLDWIIVDLALIASGKTHVPIPTFFSPQQREHALANAGASKLIRFTDRFTDRFADKCADTPLQAGRCPGLSIETLAHAPVALPAGTAKVTYTSGTTGQPKGVCLSLAAIESVVAAVAHTLSAVGVRRHLAVLPLSTLLENVAGTHAALWHGAEVLLPSLTQIGFAGSSNVDVLRFIASIAANAPDSFIVVPQLLLALTVAAERGVALPPTKFIAVGGAVTSADLIRRARAHGLAVYEGYGLSECASVATLNTPDGARIGSVGRPLPGVEIRADASNQLLIRGRGMLGYAGDINAARHSADDWYATGDLGSVDADGFVFIQGRMRNVFITAFGRNVAPEWVESELTAHPAVATAFVHGEAQATNIALLRARGAATDDELAAAVAAANSRLPDYARVGSWMRFPTFDPERLLTDNGRLRRAEVREAFRACIDLLYSLEA